MTEYHKHEKEKTKAKPVVAESAPVDKKTEDKAEEKSDTTTMETKVEKESGTEETKDNKKMTPKKAFLMGLGGALILVAVISFVGSVYLWPISSYTRTISKYVPFPAGFVGGSVITMREFLQEDDVLLKSGSVDSKETRQGVMESLISKKAVDYLAKKYEIELDAAQADDYYQNVIAQVGDEEQLKIELMNQFGVGIEDFKERVISSIVLASQLQEKLFVSEDEQKASKEEAEGWRQRLLAGDKIADMQVDAGQTVRLYDGTTADGIPLSQIPPEALEAVSSLSVG